MCVCLLIGAVECELVGSSLFDYSIIFSPAAMSEGEVRSYFPQRAAHGFAIGP